MSRGNRSIERDPVTPALREKILRRDGACVAALLESQGRVETRDHECRDRWGMPHHPRALNLLTIEHVKLELAMSQRAKSDERHCLALCYGLNVGGPSKVWRAAFREYLATVNAEPDHAHVEPVPGCAGCYAAFG
jgi:hypothetical protein